MYVVSYWNALPHIELADGNKDDNKKNYKKENKNDNKSYCHKDNARISTYSTLLI